MGAMLVPGDMLTGIGSLYGDSVSSLTELMLGAVIFDIAARWAEGFRFDEEDFQVDTIDEVGPAGHFLDQEHTRLTCASSGARRSWTVAHGTPGRPMAAPIPA
jgi:trimethylamine:corrinoid methyltransferase-like protein